MINFTIDSWKEPGGPVHGLYGIILAASLRNYEGCGRAAMETACRILSSGGQNMAESQIVPALKKR